MSKKYLLAIDQGTTGSRAFIFNSDGKNLASAYQEFTQYYPRPGWVEHDAQEIWRSCQWVIQTAIRRAAISPKYIAGIGITNQRETTVLWDRKSSKPVARAIVWQCRRTASFCEVLKKKSLEPLIQKKTGLLLDPYFSASKIHWLLEHQSGLRKRAEEGRLCFGTIDSWLVWCLSGGTRHVTDMTNASRTLLFDIRKKQWDQELLRIFKVPVSLLPQALPSGTIFAKTAAKTVKGLPAGIPIAAILGDQQAALYGQGCHEAGQMKNTYGTGSFLVCNTGSRLIRSKTGLLSTLCADVKGNPAYALEGAIFIAGAAIQWLRDEVGLIENAAESESMMRKVKDNGGVYFVPAFAGLGAPYWATDARGIITGLTRGSNRYHLVRAALEAIAYQTRDVFLLMQGAYGGKIRELRVDGGACQNDTLMQFQANMLGCRVVRPRSIESTVQGVAQLAGVTLGLLDPAKLKQFHQGARYFASQMTKLKRETLYRGWQQAVQRAL